ncbi:MAG: DUF420 domain-containing protein [Nitrospirae bacterium]|nr:DUF420 domain-containing protein [Nitrospirota bacterium]
MLPTLNAALNGLSALCLGFGFYFIRRRKIAAHRACMLSACAASLAFLVSYIVYHSTAGVTRFSGTGGARVAYFALLTSHTVLAGLVVPLVLLTLSRALRQHFDRHRAVARWTLPMWSYVSITGVLVYVMLYHLYPAGG